MTEPLPSARTRILYMVPDLTDRAVERRTEQFRAGGADVRIAGFHRGDGVSQHEGTSLGRTFDADLAQRGAAVVRWVLRRRRLRRLAEGCDVIVARNLEMLLLAWAAAPRRQCRIVYESLDIHTVLLKPGPKRAALRRLEGWLLARTDVLIVSSPAFLERYFAAVHPRHPPTLLIENKVLDLIGTAGASEGPGPRRPGPWRIGWFGMIRCRRSLELLSALVTALPGQVEVIIRGRPTAAVFDDFAGETAAVRGITFLGPYKSGDLADIYRQVDFVWALDFYEAGLNSAWLLPNRLYEGGVHDVPIIAQSDVETGRWLDQRKAGVLLADPETDLIAVMSRMDEATHRTLVQRASRIARSDLVCRQSECDRIVEALS